MSVCAAANTMPYSAVNRPRLTGSRPHHHSGPPSRSKATRSMPYTATFSITPLIRADTGEGAAGCASGSHTCSGTSPALAPNPTSASSSATPARGGESCALRIASKLNCQLPP